MAAKGREAPRLGTEPLRKLTPKTSLGFEVIDFSEQFLGVTLLPWQRWWLIHALEVDTDEQFRFRTVLTLVARQNGKTHLLKVLILWAMYSGRARLVLGAAQNLATARESWEGAIELTDADKDLLRERDRVMRGTGDMQLVLKNGSRYKITAANRSAGRGLSVDLLVLDEIREHRDWLAWSALSKTTNARPNGLIVAISNAGDDQSVVLNALRDSALADTDPTLALFEWSAEDGCDLDDEDGWAQANPGLGHTITPRAIRSALSVDPPATFRTEVLCQRVDQLDSAIDPAAWHQCADAKGTLEQLRDRTVLCLDVAPDLQHVTLVAAAPANDGRVKVDTVAAWTSTKAARADLPALIERVNPKAFGWFPGGPAAALAADLNGIKRVIELKAGDVPAVCQGFSEQISARRVVHGDDPLLNSQIAQTSKVYTGDGWRFTRRGVGHCDAVYAAAGAVHLARTSQSPGKPRVLFPAA